MFRKVIHEVLRSMDEHKYIRIVLKSTASYYMPYFHTDQLSDGSVIGYVTTELIAKARGGTEELSLSLKSAESLESASGQRPLLHGTIRINDILSLEGVDVCS